MVLGWWGAGKTLLLTILAFLSEFNVFANFNINLQNVKPLTLSIINNISYNVELLIDEGYTWIESRVTGSSINRFLSHILFQSRKRNVIFHISAQLFSTLDIRFRDFADYITYCEVFPNPSEPEYFQYTTIDRLNNSNSNILEIKDAEFFFDKYDTKEIVMSPEMDKFDFTVKTPYEKYQTIYDISELIYPSIRGTVTKARVRKALMLHDKGNYLLDDVYQECKEIETNDGHHPKHRKKKNG